MLECLQYMERNRDDCPLYSFDHFGDDDKKVDLLGDFEVRSPCHTSVCRTSGIHSTMLTHTHTHTRARAHI